MKKWVLVRASAFSLAGNNQRGLFIKKSETCNKKLQASDFFVLLQKRGFLYTEDKDRVSVECVTNNHLKVRLGGLPWLLNLDQ